MEIIIMLILLIAFGIAALRWGFNSTETFNSPEWERRRKWSTLH